MDLRQYVDNIHQQLAVAAEAGGDEARALAERLVAPLDAAVRLTLQDVLVAATEEITRELAPGSVELRLRGRDPEFVVTPPPTDLPLDDPAYDDHKAGRGRPGPRRYLPGTATRRRWRASTCACPTTSKPASSRPPTAKGSR